MFKSFIESDREKAYEFFLARQRKYERTKNSILVVVLIGAPLTFALLSGQYGSGDATILSVLIAFAYALGYSYCSADWSKDKELSKYYLERKEVDGHSSRDA